MVLQEDNTLIDDREPVTISGIQRDNVPVSVSELESRGTRIAEMGLPEGATQNTIEGINQLRQAGFISAQQAERQKNRIRSSGDTQGFTDNGGLIFQLKYDQPNVSVNSSARFTEHATIDGPIVRQRIGPGLVEISIEGVCTAMEALLLDNLRYEATIEIISSRYSGVCQVAATSTSPLEDGGAIDLDGQFTHTFGIELVEVER